MELIPNCFDIVQFARCLDHPFDRNQCLALGHQTLSSAEHSGASLVPGILTISGSVTGSSHPHKVLPYIANADQR